MKYIVILFAAAVMGAAGPIAAQSKDEHSGHHPAESKAGPAEAALTEGEVRRVDKDAKKVTIKHGPIQNLDMPAMTMVFQVADPALLDRMKAGDKIRFQADKVNGAYTVISLE